MLVECRPTLLVAACDTLAKAKVDIMVAITAIVFMVCRLMARSVGIQPTKDAAMMRARAAASGTALPAVIANCTDSVPAVLRVRFRYQPDTGKRDAYCY
jgi:hypothetical protein